MHPERRLADRHRVTFDVVCDADASYTKAKVTDLSHGGLFVESGRLLPMGTEVLLTPIGRATDHLFEVPAKVVRIESKGMGLELGEVDEDDRHGLQRLMREMPATVSGPHEVESVDAGAPARARIHGSTRAARAWIRLRSAVRFWDA